MVLLILLLNCKKLSEVKLSEVGWKIEFVEYVNLSVRIEYLI